MSEELLIYTNIKNHLFLKQLLSKYKLVFNYIDNLNKKNNIQKGSIIILNKSSRGLSETKLFFEDCLLLTNSKINMISKKGNIVFENHFFYPNQIKSYIEDFLLNRKINFENFSIIDKKLLNNKNNKFCYLTEIELLILKHLINKKTCKKDYIKKNILKIKSTIETSSIESHLTRIRKKLSIIDANLTIKSKGDIIEIFTD